MAAHTIYITSAFAVNSAHAFLVSPGAACSLPAWLSKSYLKIPIIVFISACLLNCTDFEWSAPMLFSYKPFVGGIFQEHI